MNTGLYIKEFLVHIPVRFNSDGDVMEIVIFNEVRYRRNKKYYYGRGQALHRAVWKFYRGPIPAGHEIHHKYAQDEATTDPDRLECLSKSAHTVHHMTGRVVSNETRARISVANSVPRGRQSDETQLRRSNALVKAHQEHPESWASAGMVGKQHTQATRDRMSIAQKAVDSDVRRQHMQVVGRSRTGTRWINNGVTTSVLRSSETIPDGWVFGRIRWKSDG